MFAALSLINKLIFIHLNILNYKNEIQLTLN